MKEVEIKDFVEVPHVADRQFNGSVDRIAFNPMKSSVSVLALAQVEDCTRSVLVLNGDRYLADIPYHDLCNLVFTPPYITEKP